MKAILFLLSILLNSTLLGSPILELIGGAGELNPFNQRFSLSSKYSPYFNPALMVKTKNLSTISFVAINFDLSISYNKRPDGSDVSEKIFEARELNSDGTTKPISYPSQPTSELQKKRGSANNDQFLSYIMMGVVYPVVPETIFLGITTVLPIGSFMSQSPFFPDQREQYFSNSLHFELFGDRFKNSSFSFALAYKYKKILSFGLGIEMKINSTAETEVFIADVSVRDSDTMVASVKADISFVPNFGVLFQFSDSFWLTSTLHLPYYNDINTDTNMIFLSYEDENGDKIQKQNISFRYSYEPLRLSLGGGLKFKNIDLIGGVLYTSWSQYYNRLGETPYDQWMDTISFSFGGKYSIEKKRDIGIDLNYIPTPVPEQTGRDNYVDNNRLGVSLTWREIFNFKNFDMALSFNGEFHYLFKNSVKKDLDRDNGVFDEFPTSVDIKNGDLIESSVGFQTNNPGYPGYSSSGYIYGGTIMVEVTY